MSGDIQVVDPADSEPDEPVTGLVERRPFQVGDYGLVLLQVDDESAWQFRDGGVFGWVRSGHGQLRSNGEPMELEAGDFLHVPPETVHRYAAGTDRLEILAVLDRATDVTEVASAPGGRDGRQPEVVGPDELVATVESPDLVRETPFPDADVLMMRVRAEGGAAAGWHHHGDNVYFGYAVDGPSETEYGAPGEDVARIEMGDCFHVPPGLVHRDTNPTDEAHTGIIWLCGDEPWVVNVDGPE